MPVTSLHYELSCYFFAGAVKIRQGDGGGQVVCPLALYHDNPSSNPVDVYLLLIDGAIGK